MMGRCRKRQTSRTQMHLPCLAAEEDAGHDGRRSRWFLEEKQPEPSFETADDVVKRAKIVLVNSKQFISIQVLPDCPQASSEHGSSTSLQHLIKNVPRGKEKIWAEPCTRTTRIIFDIGEGVSSQWMT